MSDQIVNTQTAPVTPPASAGNPDETQVKLAELERKSEGLLRDLQAERAKRQELEARLVTPPAVPSPANQQDVNNAELAAIINPVVAPQIQRLEHQLYAEKAKNYLSSKMGKSWEDLEADKGFQDKLDATVKKWGIVGNVHDVAVKAYEAMKRDEELETYRKQKADEAAARAASTTTSLPPGAPPAPAQTATEYDLNSWARLSTDEYDRMFASGSVRKVGDKIVFTPKQ